MEKTKAQIAANTVYPIAEGASVRVANQAFQQGYELGYNAAIQSQQDKIQELEEVIAHQGKSILTQQQRHFEAIDQLKQSIQPTVVPVNILDKKQLEDKAKLEHELDELQVGLSYDSGGGWDYYEKEITRVKKELEPYYATIQSQSIEAEYWKQVCKDLKEAILFADRCSVLFENVEDADDLKYKKTDWKQLYDELKQSQPVQLWKELDRNNLPTLPVICKSNKGLNIFGRLWLTDVDLYKYTHYIVVDDLLNYGSVQPTHKEKVLEIYPHAGVVSHSGHIRGEQVSPTRFFIQTDARMKFDACEEDSDFLSGVCYNQKEAETEEDAWKQAWENILKKLSVQPTGSVVEPIVSACDEIEGLAEVDWKENNYAPTQYKGQDKARHHRIFRQGYLAAANLPVGNGWAEKDTVGFAEWVQSTPFTYNSQRKMWEFDIEDRTTEQLLQQYKLTHSPLSDSRIEEYREWLEKVVKEGQFFTAALTTDAMLEHYNRLFPPTDVQKKM